MLDYGSIRDIFKSSDTLETKHLVLGEWNMNRSVKIQHYGLYSSLSASFRTSDDKINFGKHYLIYDEGTPEESEISKTEFYYSKLASVFEPNRPDPGIVLLHKWSGMPFAASAKMLRIGNLVPTEPRFYPQFSERKYDYFNSAKTYDKVADGSIYTTEALDGSTISVQAPSITGVTKTSTSLKGINPFVVYENSFPINKIVIKVQNHLSVPDLFSVDILNANNTWTTVYPVGSSSSVDFNDGTLELYFNGSASTANSFTKTVKYVDDLENVASESNPDTIIIKGIRFNVFSMTQFSGKKKIGGPNVVMPTSLELLEISPRLEIDLTSYTESFSVSSEIPESSFGLPVGGIVNSTGDIKLSNQDKNFLYASKFSELKMLIPDVLFKFYQLFTVNSVEYTVPIKQMYAVAWNVAEDFSVSVSLEDRFKIFKSTKVPDLVFPTSNGIPFSVLILMLLDNCGITGYEFKKSIGKANDSISNDSEDTRIDNFFCRKEQTLMEVLNDIAVSTQSAMYIDASGKLNVLTKERLTSNATITQSSSNNNGTDFWIMGDEALSTDTREYSSASSYSANMMSLSESKVLPVTDGTVQYHFYNVARTPGKILLEKGIDEDLLKDVPASILAFSDYTYKNTMLWSPGESSDAVLGAANLLSTISLTSPSEALKYTSGTTKRVIEAYDEEDAVRVLYEDLRANQPNLAKRLEIELDSNEIVTLTQYKGYVSIDNEYIKYNGKIFLTGKETRQLIMSQEEYDYEKSRIPVSKSLIPIGLLVDVEFEPISGIASNEGKYRYTIVSDGRGALDSKKAKHSAITEERDDIEYANKFTVILGGTKINSKNFGKRLTTSTSYDLTKGLGPAKNIFQNKSDSLKKAYLGYLHIRGPKSPQRDQRNLEGVGTASFNTASMVVKLDATDKQVDRSLLSIDQEFRKFLPYIYTVGDKYISGQAIDVGFRPNYISTRMRLTSDAKELQDKTRIQQTNSAIAGIVIDYNEDDKTGYYLEVQSEGDNRRPVKTLWNNLRFYKVYLNKDGRYVASILLKAPVAALTVTSGQISLTDDPESNFDPFFTLSIAVERGENYTEFTVYYGDNIVGRFKENNKRNTTPRTSKIALFVRDDSEAIYEDVLAAALPFDSTEKIERFFFSKPATKIVQAGTIPLDRQFFLKSSINNSKKMKVYYNDFARLAREVKEYDIRFDQIALKSRLIDISNINPQYMIYKYDSTPFGAKLIVKNMSAQYLKMTDESYLPLFITGIALEEVNSGEVNMSSLYSKIDDSFKRLTPLSYNESLYGKKDFNLDSKYIQRRDQAESLLRWVSARATKERLKFTCEIFATPILELGDKVKVYDPNRGYYASNTAYGNKTFVINSISYSTDASGPKMNVGMIEVG